jgi:serine/threonine protein kinase
MIHGSHCFPVTFDPDELIEKIKKSDYIIPKNASKEFIDMIQRMIVADPKKRITLSKLKMHPFFKGIEWDLVDKGKGNVPTPILREIK